MRHEGDGRQQREAPSRLTQGPRLGEGQAARGPLESLYIKRLGEACASSRRYRAHRREKEAEQMGTPRQQQQLCVVFLLALLVVFTMDAVHVDAGRALAQVGYGALNPGSTPSVPRGQPYSGRGCTQIYACNKSPPGEAP
ncbi:hypothetical protein PVAP13_9NG352814 [Panicum virgatum]|uniref:Uncharacterized protein n=1 Tax=Panicum virgatum TaxID=38727 RepID=A0A8T0MWU9_PANVG|nr:hypothetical protein PVAP13_9NG352814 [Panicum virgatum]